jgi:hypothetical protein
VGLDGSRYEPKEIVMNPIRRLRHLAGVLAGLACAWLGLAVAAPAAFAAGSPIPGSAGYITPTAEPPAWNRHSPLPLGHIHQPVQQAPVPVPVHTVVIGGTAGWQIALIAAAAALAAATVAVLVDRAWAARRKAIAAAA